ncbi:MAG: hypothetical protein HYV16_12935 [Gammaproteobacteria bacterium]|nr:hypothetical protein [Gammaproteobacteria bacterium]
MAHLPRARLAFVQKIAFTLKLCTADVAPERRQQPLSTAHAPIRRNILSV